MLIPRQALSTVLFAAKDATRHAINGVWIERDADGVPRCVATDGRRLAVVTWTEPDPADYPPIKGVDPTTRNPDGFSTLLPTADVRTILKAIPKSRTKPILEYVALDEAASSKNGIHLGVTDIESSQVWDILPLEGSFPRWQSAIDAPTSSDVTIRINARLLEDACKLARKFPNLDDGTSIVDLTIQPAADGPSRRPLRINIRNPEIGELKCIIMPCGPG